MTINTIALAIIAAELTDRSNPHSPARGYAADDQQVIAIARRILVDPDGTRQIMLRDEAFRTARIVQKFMEMYS